jgi:error-prone DNA polymerase
VRLGIGSVRGIGDDLAVAIATGRPYQDMEDLARRVELTLSQLEALATAGVFAGFTGADGEPLTRREALWAAGAVAEGGADKLAGIVTGVEAPQLPGMDPREEALADLWATGVAPDGHPTRFVRDDLDRRGVIPASGLLAVGDGTRISVAGVVTHRQRPATAGGTTFLNLEDETGLINVIVSKGCWVRHRKVARSAAALIIRGRLEKSEGVVNVVAERFEPLPLGTPRRSRDFR